MKVIFLDFDGTINNPGCYRIASGLNAPADEMCIAALNTITDNTQAKIVVSSTWRHSVDLPGLRELLHVWGAKGTVIGVTEHLLEKRASDSVFMQQPRWREIRNWVRTHKADSFVILDDESHMGEFQDRLVQTRGHIGLTMKDAERAIALLT